MKREKLLKVGAYATYSYLLVMFLMVLFFNKPGVYEFSLVKQVVCFILGSVLFGGVVVFLRDKLNIMHFFAKHDKRRLVIFFFGLFLVQLIFVAHFYTEAPYDAMVVYDAARKLPDVPSEYFSIYPNNLLLLFIERAIYKLNEMSGSGIDLYFLLVVVNTICIDVSLYLVYIITKKIFSLKTAVYALMLGLLLLGFTPWLSAVYTDTLSLPIGLLIFALYLKIKAESRPIALALYSICIGVLVCGGFLLKPSATFVMIAIVLIELFLCNYKLLLKHTKKMLTLGCVLTGIGVGFINTHVFYNYLLARQTLVPYDASQNFPYTHWMMMGLKETEYRGQPGFGRHTREDFLITFELPNKTARIQKNLSVIKERLQNFGLIGYGNFIWNKSIWILGDGTFYLGNEGILSDVSDDEGVSQFVQNIVYPSGKYYGYYVYFLQTSWLIVLFTLAFAVFCLKEYANKDFFIISCTILGTIAFILLFEGRSRYLLNNLGFFIIIASLGLEKVLALVQAKLRKN
jgi:integral membrane protein (TIGR03766 family)